MKLAIDLGTTNLLVWKLGEGVVMDEPTVVAMSSDDFKVRAFGSEAKKMQGRSPASIEVIEPLKGGVITDFGVTQVMLRLVLRQLVGLGWWFSPEVMVCVPAGATEVEQRAVSDALTQAGVRTVHLIDRPLAAAIGARVPVSAPIGNLIVHFGGGTTEAAVISLGGTVVSRSVRVGGDDIDAAIADYLKKEKGVLIGEITAEKIKLTIGSATKLKRVEEMEVGGSEVDTALPKSVKVDSGEICEVIRGVSKSILEMIKDTIEGTPPELVADIVDRGIILTGGGGKLRNFDVWASRELGVPVRLALEPERCVIKGVAVALENLEVYRRAGK